MPGEREIGHPLRVQAARDREYMATGRSLPRVHFNSAAPGDTFEYYNRDVLLYLAHNDPDTLALLITTRARFKGWS